MGAALAGMLTVGCTETATTDKTDVKFSTLEGAEAYTLENSAKEFGSEEDVTFASAVSMLMPEYLYGKDVKPLRDSILKMAFDTVGPDASALAKANMDRTVAQFGYKVKTDTLAPGATADGFSTVTGTVVNLSPEVLVYCVSTSEYQPRAAHGMTTNFYVNYDMKDGKVMTFADMFKPEMTDSLAATIQTQADALEQVIGPTTISTLPSGDNFMLSATGEIEFVYQPYEVASYAQGTIRVAFYPYELAGFMTPYAKSFFKLPDME